MIDSGKLATRIAIALCLAGAAGCANRGPIVDTQGVSQAQYQRDLSDCRGYGDQVSVGGQALGNAVGHAIVGGALGEIFSDNRGFERGAQAGAVVGGAKGTARGFRERERVVKNCMRGRGYRVLN